MANRRMRIVIDGEELKLSLSELHEQLKARGHYKWGYESGPLEGGGIWYTLNPKEGVSSDGRQED